jgi:hypothetical protein
MEHTEQLSTDLNKSITDLIININETANRLVFQLDENIQQTINKLLEIWLAFTEQSLQDPDQISNAQITYWQDYLALCEDLHRHLASNQEASSQSQNDDHWKDPILMEFAEKYYYLISHHARKLLKNIFDADDSEEIKKLEFFHHKFSEAFSVANFKNVS